jgi:muramoyltetrapeptide carboxypeptidase
MRKDKPALLKSGDKIGIVSPARFVIPSEIEGALSWMRQRGFIPVLGKHVFDRLDQFAGSDRDRAEDIRAFIDDPEIACIWATRGGYGSIRLIPYLSGLSATQSRKWFIGYSDVTVFHSWLHQKFNLQSIHGPMLFSWNESPGAKESFSKLEEVLLSGNIEYQYNTHPLNRIGKMQGVLTGGNLSMLYSMRGTDLDLDPRYKILFLEDVDEYLYHLDRMMQNFKQAGWLSGISGLLVGGMNKMNDNSIPFGQSPEEIISNLANDHNLPVVFGHPAGHQDRNLPLVFGEEIKINLTGDTVFCRQ